MTRQTLRVTRLLALTWLVLLMAGCARPAYVGSSGSDVSQNTTSVLAPSSTAGAATTNTVVETVTSPAVSSTDADVFNGVSQKTLQACIDSGNPDCKTSVPGLEKCLETYKICYRAGYALLQDARQSQIEANNGPAMTSEAASKIAIDLSTDPNRASIISIKQEVFADLPTAGKESISGLQAPDDVIFVVDVAGPNITDGGPALASKTVDEYGAVIDATSAQVIETCFGGPCTQ